MIKKIVYALSDDGGANELDITDILYIEMRKKDIIYVARQGKFRGPRNLIEVEKYLINMGFKKLDRNKLVNIHAIKSIDSRRIMTKLDMENEGISVPISSKEMRRMKRNGSIPRNLLEE